MWGAAWGILSFLPPFPQYPKVPQSPCPHSLPELGHKVKWQYNFVLEKEAMILLRTRQLLISTILVLALLVTACGGGTSEPSRWDGAQERTPTQTTRQQPVQGGQLNRFFPTASGEYQRVFAQEKKKGTALAKLKKGGKEVATLAISDTANNPRAAEKFKTATKSIGGYPAVDQGKKTSILVGRYQVTVTSKTPAAFSASDRQTWLQKFNLSGLARL